VLICQERRRAFRAAPARKGRGAATARGALRLVLAALVLALGTAGAPAQAGGTPADEASRVRVLLVVDTHGYNAAGLGLAADGDRVSRCVEELRRQVGAARCTLDVLRGEQATPDRVLEYYANLPTAPGEALVCYYNGHGQVEWPRGHFLDMAAGRLYRDDLRRAMSRHRPRLLVLLTDCCTSDLGLTPAGPPGGQSPDRPAASARPEEPPAPGPAGPAPPKGAGAVGTLRHLLFRQRGVVDITASTLGTPAFASYRRGCFFTLALVDLLSAGRSRFGRDGPADWGTFFAALQEEARRRAAREGHPQTAEAFSLAGAPDIASGPEAAGLPDGPTMAATRSIEDWIKALASADADVRLRAAFALGCRAAQAGGVAPVLVRPGDGPAKPPPPAAQPSAVPALTKAVRDRDVRVRRAAAQALGLIDPPAKDAVPTLVAALQGRDVVLQSRAALALAHIGEDAVPALREALRAKAPAVRRRAAEALQYAGAPAAAALPALVQGLRDDDLVVRCHALGALGRLGQDGKLAVPVLVGALKDDNRFVRAEAAYAVGDLGPYAGGAVPALLEAARDRDPRVRVAAVGNLGPAQAWGLVGWTTLAAATEDRDPAVRRAAALALTDLRGPSVLISWVPLGPALEDGHADVRWAALIGLRQSWAARAFLPRVMECTRDPNCRVREQAIRLLGDLRPPPREVVPLLAAGLPDGSSYVRKAASAALRRLGPKAAAAVPALLGTLKDPRPAVRRAAAAALGGIGPGAKAAVPALTGLVRDPDASVRAAGTAALARIAPQPGK
jgi:HEAT repeat protein